MATEYAELTRALGYQFQDEQLLTLALTHRSVSAPHNERLEFLGDAILDFIIADLLYKQYPTLREGVLSRLRAQFVKGEALSALASELGIHKFVKLSLGEKKSGGQQRQSILENTLEAIVAAIYLDSSLATVHQVVHAWYEERLSAVSLNDSHKDPKTRLQELLQADKKPLPTYTVLQTLGSAHAQTFTVQCSVAGFVETTQGQGSSRRKAEQAAANAFLERIRPLYD